MVSTIVTAVDGSGHSNKAVEFAVDMARKFGAHLIFVHALEEGRVPDELMRMAEVEHIVQTPDPESRIPRVAVPHGGDDREAETVRIHAFVGNQILEDAKSTAKQNGVNSVETVIGTSDPAASILDEASAKNADMIIMGSRGFSTLKGLLLGSVSQKVTHHAKCTTVCVR